MVRVRLKMSVRMLLIICHTLLLLLGAILPPKLGFGFGPTITFAAAATHHAELLCHPSCHCLDTFFQCTSLPPSLPTWIHKLNASNIIGGADTPLDLNNLLRLTELDTLQLDGNNLTSMPDPDNLPPSLQHLSLAKNAITELDLDSLPQNLLYLDLSRNAINNLVHSNHNFTTNSSLTTLNLGSNLVESLEIKVFKGLEQLTELVLTRNRLRSLQKGVFDPLVNLEKLDLSRNRLEFLDSIQFQGLKGLKELNLRRNHLSNLADGTFYGLDRIHALLLDGNVLRSIEKRWLYGLKSLRVLNLAHNEITSIEDHAWEHSDALTLIDLANNQLQKLNRHAFSGLNSILSLSLANNVLTHLDEGLFAPMNSLQSLDLSNNQLTWPLEDAQNTFLGLHQCKSLNLANNFIRTLHPQVLVPLPSLRALNMSANPLTWFPQKPLSHLPRLELSLADVHTLVCDCHVPWLQATLMQQARLAAARMRHQKHHRDRQSTQPSSTNSVLCAHPLSLAGTPLLDVPMIDFECVPELLPPSFKEQPESQVFLLEGKGRLTCVVETYGGNTSSIGGSSSSMGSSLGLGAAVEIEWRKNHEELPAHVDGGVQTSRSVGSAERGAQRLTSILELRNVTWADGGRYQCVARTTLGVAYSTPANVTIHSAPSFVKRPSNVSVRLGSNAKLECAAKGYPAPEIGFQKDGGEDFPAALDRRFHVMPNDDSFFIMEAKLADMGTYSCSASNSAGTVKAYASVVVYETPSFVARMHDESALEGSHAILECLASGSPRPLVTWSKDGAPLVDDAKFHVGDNGSFLVIRNVVGGDAGRYECLLTNAVGTARGTSILTVHSSPARSGLDNAAMTVTFIIIAVFCVVGTSAAWVVVIYRTRQRSSSSKHAAANNRQDTAESTPLTKFLEEATTANQLTSVGGGSASIVLEELHGESHSSSSSSSKDSGTGEEPPDLDNKHILTTFGTHVRTSSPLRLATSPLAPLSSPWRPGPLANGINGVDVSGGMCGGLVEEPNVVVLVKKSGDKLLIREAMRVGIPLPPTPSPSVSAAPSDITTTTMTTPNPKPVKPVPEKEAIKMVQVNEAQEQEEEMRVRVGEVETSEGDADTDRRRGSPSESSRPQVTWTAV